jgi:uncharacterized membrane protein YdcZ (DUF606 family)
MFLVWQFFVGNLLSVVLVLFPDIFVNFAHYSGGPNDYWYDWYGGIIIIIIIINCKNSE